MTTKPSRSLRKIDTASPLALRFASRHRSRKREFFGNLGGINRALRRSCLGVTSAPTDEDQPAKQPTTERSQSLG
jgi:hypothetical protein